MTWRVLICCRSVGRGRFFSGCLKPVEEPSDSCWTRTSLRAWCDRPGSLLPRCVASIERAQLPRLFLLSSVGLAGFNVFLIAVLRRADAGSVGVVVGAVPVPLALLGPLLERRRPSAGMVAAALVVTVGAAVVQWGGGEMTFSGFCLAFGAMVCEVAFTLLAVPLLGRLGPIGVSMYACTERVCC
jgi:drug/metabolite transporter (DMT)-like permease